MTNRKIKSSKGNKIKKYNKICKKIMSLTIFIKDFTILSLNKNIGKKRKLNKSK
jgi:hypothetical protein